MSSLYRSRYFSSLFFVALSIVVALTEVPAGASPKNNVRKFNWSLPSYEKEDVNPNQQTLGLIVSPSGSRQIRTWTHCSTDGISCELRSSFSRTAGRTWSTPRTLFAFKGLMHSMLHGSTDGTGVAIVITAIAFTPGTQNVEQKSKFVMHTFNWGASWLAPVPVFSRSFYGFNAEVPQLLWNEQIDGGQPFKQFGSSRDFRVQAMTWTDGFRFLNGTLINRAMISISRDYGKSWSEPTSLRLLSGQEEGEPKGHIEGTFRPDVQVSSDATRLFLSWADWSGYVYTSTSFDSGRTWTPGFRLCPGYQTMVTASSTLTNIFAVCPSLAQQTNPERWRVELISSSNSGITWSDGKRLPFETNTNLAITPSSAALLEANGRLFVVLTEKKSGELPESIIWTSTSFDGGETWRPFRRESAIGIASLSGAVATNLSGDLHLGWWQNGIFFWNRSKDFGLSWAEMASLGGGEISFPKLVVSKPSNLVSVIYVAFRGSRFIVATQSYS